MEGTKRIQMGDGWISNGERGRDAVEAVIASAKDSLAAAGFPVRSRRFPFSMHHDAYRVRLPRMGDGQRPRHADVARLMNAWAAARPSPEDYAWQAIDGALKDMIAKDAALSGKVPEDVRNGIATVRSGADFMGWVAAEAASST